MNDLIKIIKFTLLGIAGFVIMTKIPHLFIYWDRYIGGPFICDPDGGWITNLLALFIGAKLDATLGFTLFVPIIEWLTGAISYVPWYFLAFRALCLILGAWYLPKNIGATIYIFVIIIFMAVYYFHILDQIEFFYYYISMAETSSLYVKSYVWVGLGLALWVSFSGWNS